MPTEPSGVSAGIAASQRRQAGGSEAGGRAGGRWADQTVALVVEDAVEVSRMICRHLEKVGLPCAMAKSAGQALILIAEGLVPAVVLVDLGLTDLLDSQLADRLRSRCPDTPVLFMSGWAGREPDPAEVAGLRWSFLQKPFSGTEMVEAVQHLVKHDLTRTSPETID